MALLFTPNKLTSMFCNSNLVKILNYERYGAAQIKLKDEKNADEENLVVLSAVLEQQRCYF